MPRVVSIFLPELPTDRIRRADPSIPAEQPIAIVSKSGSKRWVSSADAPAKKLGIRVGMPAAKAKALFRDLLMIDADPDADAIALERITLWALSQYSPIVAVDGIDGIVMDTEGADHLQGGEEMMLTGIANRFRARGLSVRVAIADSWGAAHACARAGNRETVIVPTGQIVSSVERLPISLLRLAPDTVTGLRTLGFQTIGELSATPRAPLALRFGPEIGRRLDQMFGRVAEPIDPIRPADIVEVSRAFAEPIGAAETINKYVGRLIVQLVAELQRRGLGVRRTYLVIEKVDGTRQAIRAGTAKAARDVAWLTKLYRDRTEQIEPGFGIEKLTLVAVMTEPLDAEQKVSSLIEEQTADITPLIDILGNRGQRVYRVAPVASDDREARAIAEQQEPEVELRQMTEGHNVIQDYSHVGLTLRDHPISFLRADLKKRRAVTCAEAMNARDGKWVMAAGLVLVRQKPGSAKGVMFITIEDETGVANIVVWPKLFERIHSINSQRKSTGEYEEILKYKVLK